MHRWGRGSEQMSRVEEMQWRDDEKKWERYDIGEKKIEQ